MKTRMLHFLPLLALAACSQMPAFGQVAPGAPAAPTPPRAGIPGGGFGAGSGYNASIQPTRALPSSSSRMVTTLGFGSSSDEVPPVLVEFSATDEKTLAALSEDLSVMGRIFERTLERGLKDDPPEVMGVPMVFTGSGRSVRAMHVEGFGALFMIKVDFPVLGPPKAEAPAKKTEPPADTEWNRTRDELFGGPEEGEAGSPTPFKPEQVEALKKELLTSLKEAANIRNLRPEDYVTVTVFGAPTPLGKEPGKTSTGMRQSHASGEEHAAVNIRADQRASANANAKGKDQLETTRKELDRARAQLKQLNIITGRVSSSRTGRPGTVLSLRARKQDIDQFAAGKLDLEAFQAKANITAYTGAGYGLTSVNSWVPR